jgi:hypothetical protein
MTPLAPILLAEVMDKEPAAPWLLAWGLAIALVLFFAVRFSRWLLLLFLPVACVAAVGLTSEIRDPFIGPAILQEAGYSYACIGYVAATAPFIACLLGFIYSRKHRDHTTQPA